MTLNLQGVQEKLCFFIIHCNPSLAYIAVRDLQSSQRNASVESLLLAGNFLYNQLQPSTGEGVVANFRDFLEKNTIFYEHPVNDSVAKSNKLCKYTGCLETIALFEGYSKVSFISLGHYRKLTL